MLLQDFNYFFNKAINQYINKRYNIYDINQQTTDDLRVLKSQALLDVIPASESDVINNLAQYSAGTAKLYGGTYETTLPADYLHILNCVCIYKVKKNYKCYNKDDYVQFAAKRLTSDAWSVIINDYYNRPLPQRPYFYIHNVNTQSTLPTNPIKDRTGKSINGGTDFYTNYEKSDQEVVEFSGFTEAVPTTQLALVSNYSVIFSTSTNSFLAQNTTAIASIFPTSIIYNSPQTGKPWENKIFKYNSTYYKYNGTTLVEYNYEGDKNQIPRTINLGSPDNRTVSVIDKEAGLRYSNPTSIRMEIRYGSSDIFELEKIIIDYIKSPQNIRLTQEQVNLTEDTSQIMEFPDYVCQEIINELTMLVMENTADPRLQTNTSVTQSIANPAQQQAPQPQPQQAQRG